MLAAFQTGPYVPPKSPHFTLNFNYDWRFIGEDTSGTEATVFDYSKWTKVATPHSFNDVDSFRNIISYALGGTFARAAALLDMLNSCSPNITVVNMDNGFGADYTAVRMPHPNHDVPDTRSHGRESHLLDERRDRWFCTMLFTALKRSG